MSLRHTESSLPARHTVQEPPSYSTQVSASQKDFFKLLIYVFKNRVLDFFSTLWQNGFTKDYNYLIIVMYSEFKATLSGLLVLSQSLI